MHTWAKRGILWGFSFIIPFVVLIYTVPKYTSLTLTENVMLFLLFISFVLSLLIVFGSKGKLHLGIMFPIIGIILLVVGATALLGGINYAGTDIFTMQSVEREQFWSLSENDVNVFAGITIIGLVMTIIGIKMYINRFMSGWKW